MLLGINISLDHVLQGFILSIVKKCIVLYACLCRVLEGLVEGFGGRSRIVQESQSCLRAGRFA